MQIMSSLCDLVNMGGGMGLIIDYGEDHALSNSIRGIKEHKLYHDE